MGRNCCNDDDAWVYSSLVKRISRRNPFAEAFFLWVPGCVSLFFCGGQIPRLRGAGHRFTRDDRGEGVKKSRMDPLGPSCVVVVIVCEIIQRRQSSMYLVCSSQGWFQIQAFRRAAWKEGPFQAIRTVAWHF